MPTKAGRFRLKISEVLFFLAGAGILVSLPFFTGDGFLVWILAKIAYFTGALFYVIKK
jgi:membrane protein implicated in regulation of membrane protease activity